MAAARPVVNRSATTPSKQAQSPAQSSSFQLFAPRAAGKAHEEAQSTDRTSLPNTACGLLGGEVLAGRLSASHPPCRMQVALIVPCYNEEKRLDEAAFLSALSAQENLRIRFVNDGSRDGTLRVLRELQSVAPPFRVEVLDLPKNVGKAEAVRLGLLHEFDTVSPKAEYVGYWDADLATPLE
ncbi:MAG: hypothetical protein ACI9KE_005604, partial [Polyangiales bacterium]